MSEHRPKPSTPPGPQVTAATPFPRLVHGESTAAEKISLFRSLFRGRDDVYARRFESRKTGRSGYLPACGNEWVPGICEKPRIRCADCSHRRLLPISDEVIRWHLSGRDPAGTPFVLGLYPMLLDETCFLLAVDLDGDAWQDDARAFQQACRSLNLPVALERSRSGCGGHFWFFFTEAIPATLARKLGSTLLTHALNGRPEIGLRSYDRLFPNQDTLPSGGLGNLIALPLQREARQRGNSVFLDESLPPYPDQWSFLSQLPKLDYSVVQALVRDAEKHDQVTGIRCVAPDSGDESRPWALTPSRRPVPEPISVRLPPSLEITLSDQIYFRKADLPAPLRSRLIRIAAFQNPEFHKAQSLRLSTHNLPRIVACAEDFPEHLGLPRGCLGEVNELLKSLGIRSVVRDERFPGRPLTCAFEGELRPEQREAAQALLKHDTGVLAATTAFGKTVVAAWLIAARQVNTLILVHRQQLMEQWVDRLSAFLGIPPQDIGRLGGGRRRLKGTIDVALVQSLVRKGTVNDAVADYGQLVVDECHHLSAHSFELVARRSKAKYVVGLSATLTRKDGHHPIIHMQCGPIRHRVDARQQAAARPFTHQVIVRPTAFRAPEGGSGNPRSDFQRIFSALVVDELRNSLICDDVLHAVEQGRAILLLTERTEHLESLAAKLIPRAPHAVVLRGGLGRRELRDALERLAAAPPDRPPLLLATGRFVGEGFDHSRLDTLFVTLPVSWQGTIAQYVGRLHRLHEGKREVRVYDYADLEVPMLSRMFERRCRGYESVGYTILLPASALPGWPTEVPLPVDASWKHDYAASVRRLIRDGVDAPLGRLFVGAAATPASSAEGAGRARSTAEAFLFRRLETLPQTRGKFQLNSTLPLVFDNRGRMEVDFLAEEARLVVEIDGPQHLGDPDAYRRDRRKDALLQEHGYLVLRFLAADLSRDLDATLDALLRALSNRERGRRLGSNLPGQSLG
ncbi:MAG: DEAD/DEAH box helicase family protein [Verrucomicrobia bacterium]|nr:DEAD/DEAH box helicase family protein [Verrucomicrobiota bacterium]